MFTQPPLADAVSVVQKERSYSLDDSTVDYMSMMDQEDRKRRFSEDVVERELKDTVRLQKMYRQLQRHVSSHQNKGCKVYPAIAITGRDIAS